MKKQYLTYGAIAAFVVLATTWWWFSNNLDAPFAVQAPNAQAFEIKPTDMVHGKPDAKITIIEYASMTCPHCAEFQKDMIPQLSREYVDTGKAKLVFREYPLDGAARMASAVARCFSGDQYFSFIDVLFKNQSNWIKDFDGNGQLTKEDILEGLVQMGRQAGMSREKVASCADDPKNLALVDGNWQEGMSRYQVSQTPTFIINGASHGPMPYSQWKALLDSLAAKCPPNASTDARECKNLETPRQYVLSGIGANRFA
jgi:protein-disulfide isomerase